MSSAAGNQEMSDASRGTADSGDAVRTPTSAGKTAVALATALAVVVATNAVGVFILRQAAFGEVSPAAQVAYNSFYDGCAAVFTQAVPAFLGGIALAGVVRRSVLLQAVLLFVAAGVAGFLHPYLQVPIVSPASAHSGAMHYMLTNPIVLAAFGTLGAWIGGEFAEGRFTLADRQPVVMPGLED